MSTPNLDAIEQRVAALEERVTRLEGTTETVTGLRADLATITACCWPGCSTNPAATKPDTSVGVPPHALGSGGGCASGIEDAAATAAALAGGAARPAAALASGGRLVGFVPTEVAGRGGRGGTEEQAAGYPDGENSLGQSSLEHDLRSVPPGRSDDPRRGVPRSRATADRRRERSRTCSREHDCSGPGYWPLPPPPRWSGSRDGPGQHHPQRTRLREEPTCSQAHAGSAPGCWPPPPPPSSSGRRRWSRPASASDARVGRSQTGRFTQVKFVRPFRNRNMGARPCRSAGRGVCPPGPTKSGLRADSPGSGGRTTPVCAGGYRDTDIARLVPRVPSAPGGPLRVCRPEPTHARLLPHCPPNVCS
jgi:hypothetical protein